MDRQKEKKDYQSEKKDKLHVLRPSLTDFAGIKSTQIGPYKLLNVLGEGGFGIVYQAEQREPVRRQVALKIIKPGMDSKQVIARFEAERQALALLDHPNISRIFDGGTTEEGRPYFAMELVMGLPITVYCDQRKLSIEERLGLFTQICEAVQHAHQKGIIHRDIKPSNIIISEQDDKPIPMIIDFGVAKAIGQPLTERTLFTEQGQFIGTPEYMSPEQAGLTIEYLDTRSDIYSLGIILYELLTGTLPFSRRELECSDFMEIQRIIRETEPPRPSTRLSGMGEGGKEIAERRQTSIADLAKRMHHELEWIPLKAMRKEPGRRYRTASELADDVRNYLRGDPLIAGPESLSYRTKKLVMKHTGAIISAMVFLVMLVVSLIVITTMYIELGRAHKEESQSRAEAEALLARWNRVYSVGMNKSRVSTADLKFLAGARSLVKLYATDTQVKDSDMAYIVDIAPLKILSLGNTLITDAGLAYLKDKTALEHLCIHGTKITDDGLAYLKNLHSLKYLCLDETEISDAGLAHLRGLTSLGVLQIHKTQVTEAGIEEFKQWLPECHVETQPSVSNVMPGDPKKHSKLREKR